MAPKKLIAFVIMPFSQEFRDIYELGIKGACQEVGIDCIRVDEQIFLQNIMEQVYGQIKKADVIVAEMTGRNPNVFYEVGYAHGLAKPVILLTTESDDIPFDLRQYSHVVHRRSITTLKNELVKRIKYFVTNPSEFRERRETDHGRPPNWSNISKHILNYLADKKFEMVSFDRIRRSINEAYTDEILKELIVRNPAKFRRVRLKGDKPGIKRME